MAPPYISLYHGLCHLFEGPDSNTHVVFSFSCFRKRLALVRGRFEVRPGGVVEGWICAPLSCCCACCGLRWWATHAAASPHCSQAPKCQHLFACLFPQTRHKLK